MKYLRFFADGQNRWGILPDGEVVEEISGPYFEKYRKTGKTWKLGSVKLLAPTSPSKIVAVGLNYADHARELNIPPPPEPVIFLKPSTSVIGPEDYILCPEMSRRVDYEAELAIVIGKRARHLKPEQVQDHIFGLTCFNDVTARDLQQSDGQWTRAKSFDTFSPIGPWIADGLDPNNLRIELFHNGVRKQSSHTSQFLYPAEKLVSFISEIMTLLPGDVITTGTPVGIGPVQPGDRLEVTIEGIGTLRNYVRKEVR